MHPASATLRGSKKVPTHIMNGQYETVQRLGAGCFGEVYRAMNRQTQEEVAVKFEDVGNISSGQLEQEAAILTILWQNSRPQGFAIFHWFGREGLHNCLIMEFLGKNLEDFKQMCGHTAAERGKMQMKTVILIADQVLQRIEYLHSRGLCHRDIKPENFVFGVGRKQHHIYLIDFGLSKRYFDKVHIPLRSKARLTGTARYASLNAHRGLEHSRRDDLEAIGHMLIYFARGSLPWSGLEAKTKQEKYRKIQEKKESTRIKDLCKAFDVGMAFETYLNYCRTLPFAEHPDYVMCRKLFTTIRLKLEKDAKRTFEDYEFEWNAGRDMPDYLEALRVENYNQPDEQVVKEKGYFRCLCLIGRPVRQTE